MNTSHKSNFLSQSRNYLFTSESVSEGHPDKIADQISDRILDEFLFRDPNARVACETVLADQFVLVAGEFKTADHAVFEAVRDNAEKIVRQVLREIGYTSKDDGIDPDKCEIKIAFNRQSAHINQGVDQADGEIGAGDQGLMFGYACDETPELMPLAISLAHKLVRKQAELRKSGALPWLRPDAKSQVTVRYVDGRPVAVEKVVLSTQHSPDISTDKLREVVRREIVESVIPAELRGSNFEVLINPTGRFEVGGPNGDTGLTGRKIIVDTYGGSCPHGGGAFSGKDPSKVDRSAAYMARYIAKNIVAAGLAEKCLIQLAYAIGVVDPVSVMVDTYGTGTLSDEELEVLVRENFKLTPKGIIDSLDLKRPIYTQTASYGHFGRDGFSWEKMDKAEELKRLIMVSHQARIEGTVRASMIFDLPRIKSGSDIETLFKTVGFIVVQWGLAEQTLDFIVAAIFHGFEKHPSLKRRPQNLEQKVDFLRDCFAKFPELKQFQAENEALLSRFSVAGKKRNDVVHGAIADYSVENGTFTFTKIDVVPKEHHSIRTVFLNDSDWPAFHKELLGLGSEGLSLAQRVQDILKVSS